MKAIQIGSLHFVSSWLLTYQLQRLSGLLTIGCKVDRRWKRW